MAKKPPTENSLKVQQYLKDNFGTKLTNSDIVTALGISSPAVVATINNLVRKGHAIRENIDSTGADGKVVTTKYISLTESGRAFDPLAEEA